MSGTTTKNIILDCIEGDDVQCDNWRDELEWHLSMAEKLPEPQRSIAVRAVKKARDGLRLLNQKPRLGRMLVKGNADIVLALDYWCAGDYGEADVIRDINLHRQGKGRWVNRG